MRGVSRRRGLGMKEVGGGGSLGKPFSRTSTRFRWRLTEPIKCGAMCLLEDAVSLAC